MRYYSGVPGGPPHQRKDWRAGPYRARWIRVYTVRIKDYSFAAPVSSGKNTRLYTLYHNTCVEEERRHSQPILPLLRDGDLPSRTTDYKIVCFAGWCACLMSP